MKKEFSPLIWFVTHYDWNADKIEQYNILKYREDFIKKLKKKCNTKEEFAEKMRLELMSRFWSKCEWELVIEVDDNNRIWLNPWASCREPENVRIDVTDREDFDWRGFAETHINKQVYKNKAKIDVFNQIEYVWDDFITYLWTTRLKWERNNPKFNI